MEDGAPGMWPYWQGKHGTESALEHYYPNAAREPQLAQALAQLRNARLAINAIMQKRADESEVS